MSMPTCGKRALARFLCIYFVTDGFLGKLRVMKKFYVKAVLFWLVLLVLAIFNAMVREMTYKPVLEPYLGMWAHQLSSLTGVLLFYLAIRWFLRRVQERYVDRDLMLIGLVWVVLTVVFETGMSLYLRGLSMSDVLQAYYFWRGETWIWVLVALFIMPLLIGRKMGRVDKK